MKHHTTQYKDGRTIKWYDMPQRSLEWHQVKHGKIGGSTSAGLLNKRKEETLFYEILAQHIEDFDPLSLDDSYVNDAMQRGINLEPEAIEYMKQYIDVEYQDVGFILSNECSLLGISPDAVTNDFSQALEVKCLSAKEHLKVLYNNEIPLQYVPQVIHYFTVIDRLSQLHFICYRPESIEHYITVFDKNSMVNIGTQAKPKMVTIGEASQMVLTNAIIMNDRIKEFVNRVNF